MTYAEYKDAVIDYMKYGDNFNTAHVLAFVIGGGDRTKETEWYDLLRKELKKNLK